MQVRIDGFCELMCMISIYEKLVTMGAVYIKHGEYIEIEKVQ